MGLVLSNGVIDIDTTSFHVMACHLFGTKPIPEPILPFLSKGSFGTNFSEILINNYIFKCINMFENVVCKMSVILDLLRHQSVGQVSLNEVDLRTNPLLRQSSVEVINHHHVPERILKVVWSRLVHTYIGALLICTKQPKSAWWLQMAWCLI